METRMKPIGIDITNEMYFRDLVMIENQPMFNEKTATFFNVKYAVYGKKPDLFITSDSLAKLRIELKLRGYSGLFIKCKNSDSIIYGFMPLKKLHKESRFLYKSIIENDCPKYGCIAV